LYYRWVGVCFSDGFVTLRGGRRREAAKQKKEEAVKEAQN